MHRNLACVIDKSSQGAKLERAFEELPKNQKMIFQSFGLIAEAVAAGARSIAAKLAQTKDEKVLDEDSEGSDGNAETEIDCID